MEDKMTLDENEVYLLESILEPFLDNPFLYLSKEELETANPEDVVAHNAWIQEVENLKAKVLKALYGEEV